MLETALESRKISPIIITIVVFVVAVATATGLEERFVRFYLQSRNLPAFVRFYVSLCKSMVGKVISVFVSLCGTESYVQYPHFV